MTNLGEGLQGHQDAGTLRNACPRGCIRLPAARHLATGEAYGRVRAGIEDNSDLAGLGEPPEEDFRCDDAEQRHLGLSRISLAHREVLTLYFLEDLSLEQMADVLGVPSGTVKCASTTPSAGSPAAIEAEEGAMKESFRERLLKTEQVTPALKERYDKEIQAMLEKPLTGYVRRWISFIWTLMGLGAAMLGGTVATICQPHSPGWPGRTRGRSTVGDRLYHPGAAHCLAWIDQP